MRRHHLAKKNKDEVSITHLGVVAPPPIHVETPVFRGSLGLLFECVRDRKLDLREIPLAPICIAYLHYVVAQEGEDVDEAAAALMALSYLIERKSWLLLPSPDPEPEEDLPLELSDPTVHEYDEIIETLREYSAARERLFFRPIEAGPDPYEGTGPFGDVSSSDLARALEMLLAKAVLPTVPQPKHRPSLGDVMTALLRRLDKQPQSLLDLIPEPFTREDAVYGFLGLLELIRLGHCRVEMVDDEVKFSSA